MDFGLTEEQAALRDTVEKFLQQRHGFETWKAMQHDEALATAFWTEGAEMGLIGLGAGEEYGGAGMTALDTLLMHQSFGAALVRHPFLAASVAIQLIERLGSSAQQEELLPALIAGTSIAVMAHHEGVNRDSLSTSVAADGQGFVLSGRKALVFEAGNAGFLLVSARFDSGEVGVFVVPADAAGLAVQSYQLLDARWAGDITLDAVRVPQESRLGSGDAPAALAYATDYTMLVLCAETVGGLDRAIAITAEYLRQRQQFGQKIGKFQAVQHRMADMLVEYEQCLSSLYVAMAGLAGGAETRGAAISLAKYKIGSAGRYIANQAVQLHGGMGVTEEYSIGQYLKRVLVNDMLYGDANIHLARHAAAIAADGDTRR